MKWLYRTTTEPPTELFEAGAGTKRCQVKITFGDPHDGEYTAERERFFDLLNRSRSGKIRICVEFESDSGDPECNTLREVDDVRIHGSRL